MNKDTLANALQWTGLLMRQSTRGYGNARSQLTV